MKTEYIGLEKISGPLVFIKTPKDASFDEQVVLVLENGETRMGNITVLNQEIATIQVYEGTSGICLDHTKTILKGEPMMLSLSEEMLGRVFDSMGRPIDGLEEIPTRIRKNVNASAINPVSRQYPRNVIETGISAIDGLMTLIRGQKLPIFSSSGLPHDALAQQIIQKANIKDSSKFAIVLGMMGVEYETAASFRTALEQSGVLSKVTIFQNLSHDPSVERILTPRVALTFAEYLAFDLDYQVLVVLTDMTAYAESLREISSLKGEIPSRKGYPGYLYSDFASLYERAGKIKGRQGSITQIPILTMPNEDISHPIPDMTGYITEGQIVLSRELYQKGIMPPIDILNSLSRLMKDGIGKGETKEDHMEIANQIFSSYSKVQEIRALAKVLGENDLSPLDRTYLAFGDTLEKQFIHQGVFEKRSMEETLTLALNILSILPKEEWDKMKS